MKIYFAHPAFTDTQVALREIILSALDELQDTLDIEVFDPFDWTPNIEGDREEKRKLSPLILHANHALMDNADLMIAVIDDRDQGVTYEIGYFNGIRKPVITVSNHDYDVNIMLGASVKAHITKVVQNIQKFRDVIISLSRLHNLENQQ